MMRCFNVTWFCLVVSTIEWLECDAYPDHRAIKDHNHAIANQERDIRERNFFEKNFFQIIFKDEPYVETYQLYKKKVSSLIKKIFNYELKFTL